MTLRIVFMGTPEFSVPTLSEIISAGHEVVAVYSQPPRAAGRGMNEKKTPVHEFAEQMGIPVHTPKSLKKAEQQEIFKNHNADVAIVVAYGLILPKAILDAPEYGCLNLHASLLPRWRGAAPIQRAIMAGDTESGIMVMQMDEGLDTGDICLGEQVPIDPNMTAGELHDKLSSTGADLMVRGLAALSRDSLSRTPQPEEGVTYAKKIEKSEARIDWSKTAQEVHNHIRGLSPFPGAWFEVETNGKKERVKVLKTLLCDHSGPAGTVLDDQLTIACGDGSIRLTYAQRAGKKPMSADELLRGFNLAVGEVLS